jgi:hypothetical protein
MRRRAAKHRQRTDWQRDLKPVALTNPPGSREPTAKQNGARPAPPASAGPSPTDVQALAELRANDAAVIESLAGIRALLNDLNARVGSIEARLAAIETRVNDAAEAAARPARAVRDTSRSLRDSSTGTFDRRARRATLRVADDEASQ